MISKKEKSPLITSREMRALEINAEYFGISLLQLMENAGHNIAAEVAARFPKGRRVVIFCGLGGNGGDGFVAARHLLTFGFEVSLVLAGRGRNISHAAARANFSTLRFLEGNIPIQEIADSSVIPKVDAEIIIDALLGTGTKGRLRPPIFQLVEQINALNGFKVAIDVPTGIDSDTGEILGGAVKADLTLTFHASKAGLGEAKKYVGELIVKDIGLPKQLERYTGPGDVQVIVRKRAGKSHKGDFGRVLVIGGSEVFSGAPTLASLAALRTGADIVYLAAPTKTAQTISSLSPDLITIKLDGKHLQTKNVETLKPYIDAVDGVVLGPGLGVHPDTKEFVKACINEVETARKPLLLDADGLKSFTESKRPLNIPLVLTPHAGEYAIFSGQRLPEKLEEKVVVIKNMASEINAVILLKGHIDVICSKNRVKLNMTGNPGMTVGGTGDVLAGVVGTLLAQRVDAFEAAAAGAFVNGAAGDFVADKVGYHMLASDLLDWIPHVLEDPMSHIKVLKHWSDRLES
jgi:hydroxyethylthiazole kinase-like uncharacterized protein yjeF